MNNIIDNEIENYCIEMSLCESQILKQLSQATHARMRYPHNMSNALISNMLRFLIQLTHSKNILEIGMFTGYASLSMAQAIPSDGHIYCCETNPRAIDIAKEFFEEAGVMNKISILFGHALETIPQLNQVFDFIFIDADKNNYLNYLQLVLPKLNTDGFIVIDDALWRGEIIKPNSKRAKNIAACNQYIKDNPHLENVLLPIRHGINIVKKIK